MNIKSKNSEDIIEENGYTIRCQFDEDGKDMNEILKECFIKQLKADMRV